MNKDFFDLICSLSHTGRRRKRCINLEFYFYQIVFDLIKDFLSEPNPWDEARVE